MTNLDLAKLKIIDTIGHYNMTVENLYKLSFNQKEIELLANMMLEFNNEITELSKQAEAEQLVKHDVMQCNFKEHYDIYWDSVKDFIDENGWVYTKDVQYMLDAYFEQNTGLEIDFQKSFSFLSGDNPNWLTKGARWRPKSISLFYNSK